ncbi:MAG TPA: hypothetical protein VMO26_00255 [Vicinamibacterales bacterium]|nr:hypothetical protein [Vicinamibacterales bacterium]
MEIREGFIIGVFNYCDRWCETCALTSYCRVFADMARADAGMDPNMAPVVNATPAVFDGPRAPMKWLEDVLVEMNGVAGGLLTREEIAACEPRMAAAHEQIYERAKAYCLWAHDGVGQLQRGGRHDATDPVSVIFWFSSLNASKIRRALSGLAEFDGDRELPPDHEGAAKVALVGIDRSYAAWQQLVAERRVSAGQAQPCLEELAWLRVQLEAAIPNARGFVRPGFDEPEAVAGLRS